MKEKKHRLKRILLPVMLTVLLVLFAMDAAAITTPWIEVQENTETGESGGPPDQPPGDISEHRSDESGEAAVNPPDEEKPPAEQTEQEEIWFDNSGENGTTVRNETENASKQSIEAPKKQGCGSTIPQSGVWVIFAGGITEIILLMRKEKHDESAN